jgi:tRNA(Ile)-lysidine synthase TilS/MesJ
MGFDGMDFTPVKKLCKKLNVPYTVKQSKIARIVFDERKEKNPCALCARMRRAALCKTVKELGMKKIALAHQYDDTVETFLLSLIYEGRMHCFRPVTYLDRTDVTQIRPMLYVKENTVISLTEAMKLPVVKNTCPMNGVSKREDVKTLLKVLSAEHPDIKAKIFGAIKRLPIKGW